MYATENLTVPYVPLSFKLILTCRTKAKAVYFLKAIMHTNRQGHQLRGLFFKDIIKIIVKVGIFSDNALFQRKKFFLQNTTPTGKRLKFFGQILTVHRTKCTLSFTWREAFVWVGHQWELTRDFLHAVFLYQNSSHNPLIRKFRIWIWLHQDIQIRSWSPDWPPPPGGSDPTMWPPLEN
jgi:hypothetical protein